MKDVSHPFVLHDANREDTAHEVDRQVITDVATTEPYLPETDSWARVPLRISHNAAVGFVLEVGPYDFSDDDLESLALAVDEIRAFRRNEVAS